MASIEAEAHRVEVADACGFYEVCRRGEVAGEIFKEQLNAKRCCKGFEMFDGGEREVERFGGPAVVFQTEMKNAGAERDLLGGVEGALDLVHGGNAMALVTGDEVQRGLRMARPGDLFRFREDRHVHGRDDGVGTKPDGEFTDGIAVGVVEVMARGEDLDEIGTCMVQRIEVCGIETVGKEEMSRDASGHAFTVAQSRACPERVGVPVRVGTVDEEAGVVLRGEWQRQVGQQWRGQA